VTIEAGSFDDCASQLLPTASVPREMFFVSFNSTLLCGGSCDAELSNIALARLIRPLRVASC
jgi:hypothetical protein